MSSLPLNLLLTLSMVSPATFAAPKKARRLVCEHVRAAFDVGSSATKMKVFKVNVCKQRIIEQLFPKTEEDKKLATVDLDFASDLLKSRKDTSADPSIVPYFSTPMILKAEREFAKLKSLAEPYKPDAYVAVATQAFRESRNAADVVVTRLQQNLGIKVLVPLQTEEALLEWVAASSDMGVTDLSTVVTWGIGGGSMQIGTRDRAGQFTTFTSVVASTNMLDAVYQGLQRTDATLLPVTHDEIEQMIGYAQAEAGRASGDIKNKLTKFGVGVIGVGGVINKSVRTLLVSLGITDENAAYFTQDNVNSALNQIAGADANSDVFAKVPAKFRNMTVTNLALVLGTMRELRIPAVYYSSIDNTYAAPFAKELGLNMKLRVLRDNGTTFRPPIAPWVQDAKADFKAAPRADASGAAVRPAAPPAPVEQVTEENSVVVDDGTNDNLQACNEMGLEVKNGVCEVPESVLRCVPICHGTIEPSGKCRTTPTGKAKTVMLYAKVCEGNQAQ
jgi:hypothetical protein